MALTFVTSLTETAGVPFHVTFYLNGAAVAPASITFASLPPGATAVADATGFNVTVPDTGSQSMTANGPSGSVVTLSLAMNPPVLQVTSP